MMPGMGEGQCPSTPAGGYDEERGPRRPVRKCDGPLLQYAGGFDPQAGFGGFGGGACSAVRTPVVFLHGNGDWAINWDSPVTGPVKGFTPPARSVYQEFRARGYYDCELFGVTYLSAEEQASPKTNYHRPEKYDILIRFIEAVKAYTGKAQVDIVAHSLGASMTIAALTHRDDHHPGMSGWAGVRRFVNIAGGIRGLPSCLAAGYNRWTGDGGPLGMRRAPERHPKTAFYTLHAEYHDPIHCTTTQRHPGCDRGALFAPSANVRAQLNVGAGSQARKMKFDFEDWRPTARSGIACKGSYTGGPVK
jgi:pimeloyl-ACP methyl ester carboxylesterase